MAPKSTGSKASDGDTKATSAPSSRRSGRLAGNGPEHVPKEDSPKKRSAEDKSDPAPSKKTKTASQPTSKATKPASKAVKPTSKATKPKSKATKHGEEKAESGNEVKEDTIEEDKAEDKAEAEAEAEEKEKEAEASAEDEPTTDGEGKVMKKGDILPKVTLKDEEGNNVEVGKLAGEKGVVLFLYPKANTPGCTNQACGFRDAFEEIQALGYEVYGLSRDGPTAQKNWKAKQKLNYHLLCDPDSILIKKLGAFVRPKNTKRSSFIFEKGSGKLIEAQYGVKPADE